MECSDEIRIDKVPGNLLNRSAPLTFTREVELPESESERVLQPADDGSNEIDRPVSYDEAPGLLFSDNPENVDRNHEADVDVSCTEGTSDLVVACWNVGGLFKNHKSIFESSKSADIACLVETFIESDTAPHIRVPEDRHVVHVFGKRHPLSKRASGGYALVVKNTVAKPADCSFVEFSPGICVASIKLNDTQKITVVVVYRAAKAKSPVYDANFYANLTTVLAEHENENLLLMGDFNTKMGDMTGPLGLLDFAEDLLPSNAVSSEVDLHAEELFEVLSSAQMYAAFDDKNGPVRDTFRCWSGKGTSLIDFVYTNAVLHPVLLQVDSEFHLPCNHAINFVRLDMAVQMPTPAETQAVVNRMRVFDLQRLMELEHTNDLRRLAASSEGFDVHSAAEVIRNFVESFTSVVSTKIQQEKRVESTATINARRAARRIERRMKVERDANKRTQLRLDWLTAASKWRESQALDEKRKVEEARAKYYEAVQNKNMFQAWRIARRNLAGKGGGIRDKVTSFISKEDWESHFSQLFAGRRHNLVSPVAGQTVPMLDEPFTGEDVAAALESKKNHRALGPDAFSIDHIRVLRYDVVTCQALATFMNLCVRSADVPSEWGHAFLFILYKGTGPKDDPNSFRGITLKSQLLKLFESLLCSRLRAWAEAEELLPREQIAYRPGRHGADHLYSLTLLREQFCKNGEKLHAAFIDLRKAFPSVDRQKLLDELSRIGVSDQFLRILTRLYSCDTFSVLLDGKPGNQKFPIATGVHEGSPLSPLLFIIFIAGLSRHLRTAQRSRRHSNEYIKLIDDTYLYCLLYADDVLLLALSANALQEIVDETCVFFETMGLTVNPGKSDIVVFLNQTRTSTPVVNDEEFKIAGLDKSSITSAKYLGVLFQDNGTWKEQMNVVLTRCRMARGRAHIICRTLGFSKPRPMLQVYDMFVSSIFRYSLGAWGPIAGDLRQIDNLFCDYIKRLYNLPPTTCRKGILAQFARRCANCDARYLAAVHLARGLAEPTSVWANVLATTWRSDNRWLNEVRCHLRLLGIEKDVLHAPALFLGERREHERMFNVWCHRHHLTQTNGSSADAFRCDRPYGIYPVVFEMPAARSRAFLALVLSCWRWSFRLRGYPNYCSECDCLATSEHVMFYCEKTRLLREQFLRTTGFVFCVDALREPALAKAIGSVCEQIVDKMLEGCSDYL